MNREEHRVLRAIEANLAAEDPALAELLRRPTRRRPRWIYLSAGCVAMVFGLVGNVLGDVAFLLTAALLAIGAVLLWAAQAVADDEIGWHRN